MASPSGPRLVAVPIVSDPGDDRAKTLVLDGEIATRNRRATRRRAAPRLRDQEIANGDFAGVNGRCEQRPADNFTGKSECDISQYFSKWIFPCVRSLHLNIARRDASVFERAQTRMSFWPRDEIERRAEGQWSNGRRLRTAKPQQEKERQRKHYRPFHAVVELQRTPAVRPPAARSGRARRWRPRHRWKPG